VGLRFCSVLGRCHGASPPIESGLTMNKWEGQLLNLRLRR
jgi:hypothetical protein